MIPICLTLAASFALVQFATAAFLPDYTGNSQFVLGPGLPNIPAQGDGVVNFAVYENDDDDLSEFAGFSPTSLILLSLVDETADYVYMYQIVNTNPDIGGGGEGALVHLTIPLPYGVSSVTSVGYFDGYVFDDATPGGDPTGPTGFGGNTRLGGPEVTSPAEDVPGDASPSFSGAVLDSPPLVGSLGATDPILALLDSTASPDALDFYVLLTPSSYTSVMFLTSNLPPVYKPPSTLHNSPYQTLADIPVPGPEPSTTVMGIGVLVCGLVGIVAAKRKGAASS
jgi:hypothetical protein